LNIELFGFNNKTRYHIICTHFFSSFKINELLDSIHPFSLFQYNKKINSNYYLKQRILNDFIDYYLLSDYNYLINEYSNSFYKIFFSIY
jgi:hypothetical protein